MVLITESGPETIGIGEPAPDFELPATDGNTYRLSRFVDSRAVVLIFTCNHCPYARAYDDRLSTLVNEFSKRGVSFLAINSNDAVKYPEDRFEKMAERKLNYPYAQDASQETAAAYGAVCTPHFFVLDEDRTVVYEGRLDDNWKEPAQVKHPDLKDTLEALLSGDAVPHPNTNPMGCSIKWKSR
jgi:peroxiredoxin